MPIHLPFDRLKIIDAKEAGRYNRIVGEIAGETHRPLVDIVTAFEADGRGEDLWNSPEDPFHPNASGHEIIGRNLAEKLEPILREIARKK